MRTYGEITFEEGMFWIRCEPHVAIRLRRVFARAGKVVKDRYAIAPTPENAYELLWFMQRFPLEVRCQAEIDREAVAYSDRRKAVLRVGAEGYQAPLFPGLAIELRDYQRAAADLALTSGSLLIADDLGLGKSATAIGLLTEPKALPALVVTMTHLALQWENELKKFAPHLTVFRARDSKAKDLTRRRGGGGKFPDVVVMNYHKLRGWSAELTGKVRAVIFDEIQELRRTGTEKYDSAIEVANRAGWRVGLSATPIYNYGVEMFNVMGALAPNLLGTRSEFCLEWCKGREDDKSEVENPKALGAYLRDAGLMIRRTRAEVGRELPGLQVAPHYIEMDSDALDKVNVDVANLCRAILRGQISDHLERLKMGAELDWRLRQATGLAKAKLVAEFVKLLVESGESVVLFGWHHEVYRIWSDELAHLNPALYTGQETENQKAAARQRFLDGESKVLIMSLRSGAGLDGLQIKARTVVFGELDWSPGVHEQCIGRVHRDGQRHSVVAYYLIGDDGSDPIIADTLGIKAGQIAGIRGDDNALTLGTSGVGRTEDNVRRLAAAWLAKHGGGGDLADEQLLDGAA